MTFLEATNAIEAALTTLELKDPWGDPYVGIEAVGLVGAYFGREWSTLEDDVEAGRITPAQYAEAAIAKIKSYGRYRFRRRLEMALVDMAQQAHAMAGH